MPEYERFGIFLRTILNMEFKQIEDIWWSGLITALVTLLVNRVVDPLIPSIETLAKYSETFVFFSIKYLLPLTGIAWLLITPGAVDRYFILALVCCCCALVCNLLNS